MQAQQTQQTSGKQAAFPFKLEDLHSWTVRRTDGTVTKFILSHSAIRSANDTDVRTGTVAGQITSMAAYCTHKPGDTPIAEFERKGTAPLRFWIGNMSGARATKDGFDFVIDTGDILNQWSLADPTLTGDPELTELLNPFVAAPPPVRVLKIDWDDRAAPNVVPEFWTELNKQLYGDVMTCCVGGHGRSGTSFVCLLLNNAPDYDALDAIVHVRAVHCSRAIESVSQHEYINDVAKFLGRAENAKSANSVKDYKAAFLASKKSTAIATRKMLGWK